MSLTVGETWLSCADSCWCSHPARTSYKGTTDAWGYVGDCKLPVDLGLPCTTVREGTVTEPGLAWDMMPGGAARCLQRAPCGEMEFGAGASTQLPSGCPLPWGLRWALCGRKSYTSKGLLMALLTEGIQDSWSLRLYVLF